MTVSVTRGRVQDNENGSRRVEGRSRKSMTMVIVERVRLASKQEWFLSSRKKVNKNGSGRVESQQEWFWSWRGYVCKSTRMVV